MLPRYAMRALEVACRRNRLCVLRMHAARIQGRFDEMKAMISSAAPPPPCERRGHIMDEGTCLVCGVVE